ncbi:MAG: tRNA uridine-5-carboxymethylaminomethyl(34) synthesis GTPase MnmE [Bacteroidaceae bacterium]|nr:tRNA uridine-5-carboxymethylaminomethyl(34) synthesis GTPase MnmE [Bacteroidaceae bacterium]
MNTICAIATPPGGAIGIVRISGPDAIGIADEVFRTKGSKSLGERKTGTIAFGTIEADGSVLDEVLVSIFRAPHSYTGEDSVEIACHGSPYILNKVVQLLTTHGCRMAEPGEYTQRAFLNGKMDLSQAEAVADLIASGSAASHRIAINQMRGGISHRLGELRNKLLQLTSLLELELDFSEEDIEFADRSQLLTLAEDTAAEISRLTATFADGNALRNGVPVAIVGAPNVGKSTLLNALLRDDKAIVSPVSGTTRDTIEDTVTLGGILFRFIDTAGLRHTTDTIEQMGIERAKQAASRARIIIMMTEPGVPYPEINAVDGQTIIKIVNKTPEFQAINGTGLPQLERQLVAAVPQVGSDTVLITNVRHKQALDLAHADIQRAIASLRNDASGDLVAEDLRQCLAHLAEIVGEISDTAILENIFKNFCIGK